ncbi:MAG TPA: hypothetical protein GXX23_10915 [Firmicutes bacterium]|nr:hypothetical protein [Candidatus Fermentithermobacillaceae bacterium]
MRVGTGRGRGNLLVVVLVLAAIVTVACPVADRRARASHLAQEDTAIPAASSGSPASSLEDLEKHGITEPVDRVFQETYGLREFRWQDLVKDILSGKGIDFAGIGRALIRAAAGDFLTSSAVLGKIMLIGVAIASLEILSETLAPSGSNKIAIWACHVSLIVLAVMTFNEILGIAKEAMASLRSAFFAFIPALTSLSLVSAAPVTASVLHPIVWGVGVIASVFILDLAFPMIYTSVALDLAGSLGGGDRASGVASMLRQVAFFATGLVMSCFVGVVVGQRAATGLADGMAFRTAKYVSSTFIPVAGKAIGDTMDMFFVSTYGLRSAIGLVGCIGLFVVVFSPLLKVLASMAVWKVSAAVLGPIAGASVAKSLKVMADGITFVAVALFATCFVFIICLSLVAQAVRPF